MRPVFTTLGILVIALAFSAITVAQSALTIYNQQFAVVRESIPLDLGAGENAIEFDQITAHVEPDSVILRDLSGNRNLRILEQNYRADPVSQLLLLSHFEGQTIEFDVPRGNEHTIVSGKIIRSGYVPHQSGRSLFGPNYWQTQMMWSNPQGAGESIIEINGQLRFGLPGTPLFPALADDSILKPMLNWIIEADPPGKFDAELSYVTGGMTWEADYNAVAPIEGETIDLVGWITLENQSGRTFENSNVKVMAGDINKIQQQYEYAMLRGGFGGGGGFNAGQPPVTEKSFDEYHLYTLNRPVALHDRETKQVEFLRAAGVAAKTIYVYHGALIGRDAWRENNYLRLRMEPGLGIDSNPKVWVMKEIRNSEENRLGVPLPKGRVRLYREDSDARAEFIGEDEIDHTPKDETLRLYTGNAFDLIGERKRTDFSTDSQTWFRETFEIKVRNHKEEDVEVLVLEDLYRWTNWEIEQPTAPFTKTDSQSIEFRIPVAADGETTVTYTAHYFAGRQ